VSALLQAGRDRARAIADGDAHGFLLVMGDVRPPAAPRPQRIARSLAAAVLAQLGRRGCSSVFFIEQDNLRARSRARGRATAGAGRRMRSAGPPLGAAHELQQAFSTASSRQRAMVAASTRGSPSQRKVAGTLRWGLERVALKHIATWTAGRQAGPVMSRASPSRDCGPGRGNRGGVKATGAASCRQPLGPQQGQALAGLTVRSRSSRIVRGSLCGGLIPQLPTRRVASAGGGAGKIVAGKAVIGRERRTGRFKPLIGVPG